MFDLVKVTTLKDGRDFYKVKLDNKCTTLSSFLENVLSNKPNDNGFIYVYSKDMKCKAKIEYDSGKVLNTDFGVDCLNKQIWGVYASEFKSKLIFKVVIKY